MCHYQVLNRGLCHLFNDYYLHSMRKVLVIYVHPAPERSMANSVLLSGIEGMPGVHIHDLYDRYPDFFIDVEQEKRLLLEHDVVIFQHPFYWYSAPALLKQWQDLVLEHGWAYGSRGKALHGKITFNAITTGGGAIAYQPEGFNRFTIRQFLAPFEQTARLCGMEYLPPFLVQGTHQIGAEDLSDAAHDFREVIQIIQEPQTDLASVKTYNSLNTLSKSTNPS